MFAVLPNVNIHLGYYYFCNLDHFLATDNYLQLQNCLDYYSRKIIQDQFQAKASTIILRGKPDHSITVNHFHPYLIFEARAGA
jgi:hypothetical protein